MTWPLQELPHTVLITHRAPGQALGQLVIMTHQSVFVTLEWNVKIRKRVWDDHLQTSVCFFTICWRLSVLQIAPMCMIKLGSSTLLLADQITLCFILVSIFNPAICVFLCLRNVLRPKVLAAFWRWFYKWSLMSHSSFLFLCLTIPPHA